MKYDILEDIGNHFLSKAIELTKQEREFCVVLDNIDWEIKVHDMRKQEENISEHAVANTLVFNRVESSHL